MKFISLIALTAALTIATPAITFAQDAAASGTASGGVSGTTDANAGDTDPSAGADANAEAGVDANVDSDGDGQISAEEQAAADAEAGVDASIDTDGDGQISDDEQAAADAAADTDGDGVVSAEERAAAEAGGTASCSDVNIGTLAGMQQGAEEAAIAAATNARVVLVGDCAADELSSTLASEGSLAVQSAVGSNPELVSQIQARGATVADIIGAAVVAGTLTIYVADDGAAS